MTGIFLLVVVAIWLAIAIALTRFIRARVSLGKGWIRVVASFLIFVVLLVLPVADEIIGGFQFRALCEKNAVLHIDAAKIKGKSVRVDIGPSNEILNGKAILIYHSHLSFRDLVNHDELASYDRYVAKGGWFIRMLGISEDNAPLTIDRPSCSPPDRGTIPQRYGFTLTN